MKIGCEKTNREAECKYCNEVIEKGEPRITSYTKRGQWYIQKKFHVGCFLEYVPEWVEKSCEYAQKVREEKGPIVRQSKYPVDKRQAIYAINSKISYHKRHGHEDKVRTLSAMRNNLINGKEAVEVIRKYPVEHREAIYNLRRLQHYHKKMENYDRVDEIEATIQGMIMEESNG
ncbi:MAG: hypothetical protein SVY53_05265 [Chloroflexota bacterium]|nr:hypothetical protein [Chloroflexota bacterium]